MIASVAEREERDARGSMTLRDLAQAVGGVRAAIRRAVGEENGAAAISRPASMFVFALTDSRVTRSRTRRLPASSIFIGAQTSEALSENATTPTSSSGANMSTMRLTEAFT